MSDLFDNTKRNEYNAQLERLAILAEECAEVIQVVNKIIRHGIDSFDPTRVGPEIPTNRQMLEHELGDVNYTIQLMAMANDISLRAVDEAMYKKAERIKPYLHFN